MTVNPTGPLAPQGALLDFLIAHGQLKNDAALATHLDMTPPAISKLRHGRINLSARILLNIHDRTQLPLATLREYAGREA